MHSKSQHLDIVDALYNRARKPGSSMRCGRHCTSGGLETLDVLLWRFQHFRVVRKFYDCKRGFYFVVVEFLIVTSERREVFKYGNTARISSPVWKHGNIGDSSVPALE